MKRPTLHASLALAGLLLFAVAGAAAAEDPKEPEADFVARLLGREIIGPRQTLAEAIDFCESDVPRMPEVANLADWQQQAGRMRSRALKDVIYRGEAASWRAARTGVEWLQTIDGGTGYRIKKLRYEALPGLWIPALLYEPDSMAGAGKVPVVLNVNGHDAKGKAADYKQIRCINLARKGMLALNLEWFGMGQFRDGNSRHDLINHIDLCGTAGIATHYLAMKRGLDLLLSLEHADPERVAVTGLSGGGWQTIFLSAFDTRVTLTNPVAGYSSFRTRVRHFSDLGDSEQTPCDLATVTDYAPMTAMLAPRAALLTYNAADQCCFAFSHALPPLLEAASPIYRLYGKPENLRSHVNTDPGTHNYGLDNRQAFYRMVGDHFFKDAPGYDAEEVSSDAEVKTSEALHVDLPDGNASLHSLALGLSKTLPRDADLPGEADAARSWREGRRARLRELVRARRYDVQAQETSENEGDGIRAVGWRLKIGEWSVPVVEMTAGETRATVLLLADSGRKSVADEARSLLADKNRVLAVDPFLIGESRIAEKEYLFALLVAAVGDRPLGIQASQIAAIARWARQEHPAEPVKVAASGPRTGTMALVAAGLDDAAIDELTVRNALGSLKELIESKQDYQRSPELFCFGLLGDFDIRQLVALAAPRKVSIPSPSERAGRELAGLKAWYATWGVDWEPLR